MNHFLTKFKHRIESDRVSKTPIFGGISKHFLYFFRKA